MAVKKGFFTDFSLRHPKQFGLWRADFSLELTEEISVASESSRVVIIYPCLAKWSIGRCTAHGSQQNWPWTSLQTLPLIEEYSNPLPEAIYISLLTIREGRRLTAVHYNFVVIDLFQSTLAFSEELSCGSVPCYCYRYILLLFSESGHQDITGFNHRIAFILHLF